MISGWVFSQNLRPLFEMVSLAVGYPFDASDWLAVEHGLSGTDADADEWFSYPLIGEIALDVEVAWSDRAAGGDEIITRIPAKIGHPLDVRLETIFSVLNSYRTVGDPLAR